MPGKGVDSDMCARPGKILSSPKMIRIIHSASTLSVESRRRYRYRLKIAMRNAVADMKEILEGEDPKSAAFLRSELKKLPVFTRENDGTALSEDGGPAAVPGRRDTVRSGQPEGTEDGSSKDSSEADAGMDLENSLWG